MNFLASMSQSLEAAGLDPAKVRVARRVAQVQDMWTHLVEEAILLHTNAVYVFDNQGVREMHVYVDDSIYAAELNARRELLVMRCAQLYGEQVDVFHIHVSAGQRKATHPFTPAAPPAAPAQPLSPHQEQLVGAVCDGIENPALRSRFRDAMIADLQRAKPKS